MVIDRISNGTLTFKDIDREMAIPEEAGGIKKNILLTYKKGLESRINKDLNYMLQEKSADKTPTSRANKVAAYLSLINNYIDDDTDIWAAKEQLANAWKDGVIDGREAKVLNPLKKAMGDIKWNRSTDVESWARFRHPIITGIKALQRMMKETNASDEDLAIRIKQLLGTNQAVTPEKAKGVFIDYVNSMIPEMTMLPKTGQLMMDGYGNKAIVYPDGTIEEYGGQLPGVRSKEVSEYMKKQPIKKVPQYEISENK